MTAFAEPGNDVSNFDVVLTNGAAAVGLVLCNAYGDHDPLGFEETALPTSSLKTYSGTTKYSDGEPPWMPIEQTDWSGGRGGYDYDKDSAKYAESHGVLTNKPGEIILAGMPTHTKGYRNEITKWAWYYTAGTLSRAAVAVNDYVGFRYTPAATDNYRVVTFVVRLDKTTAYSGGSLTVRLRADNSGAPSTVLDTTLLYLNTLVPGIWYEKQVMFVTGATQNAGTYYWIEFSTTSAGVSLLVYPTTAGDGTYTSPTGASFSLITPQLYIQLAPLTPNVETRYFEYKGGLFCATNPADGSATQLWLNGDMGVATGAQTAATFKDTTKTWSVNAHRFGFVRIMDGPGSDQPQPWRLILSNTADTLTVSPSWDTVPVAGSTQYAIVGVDRWKNITSWPVGQLVRDVLPVNGAVYFAHGDAITMTRLVMYNNAGAWTTTWATEGGAASKFTHLLYSTDQRGPCIYGAKGMYPAQVWRAPIDATNHDFTDGAGSDLTFTLECPVGDMQGRINKLVTYGEYGTPWVLKEEGIYELYDSKPYRKSAAEMSVEHDYRNGKGATVRGVYLYTSQLDGVVRYYNGMIDGVGPERDSFPIPADERGYFPSLIGYPGAVYAAHRSNDGTSTVRAYNNMGWCTLYKAPAYGLTINQVYVQALPGDGPARLWYNCGPSLMYVQIAANPYGWPAKTEGLNFVYTWQGTLQTARYFCGRNMLNKYLSAISVALDKLPREIVGDVDDPGLVDVYYRIGDGDWVYVATADYSGAENKFEISAAHDAQGKSIQFMFALSPSDEWGANFTPRIIGTVLDAIVRELVKPTYTLYFRLADRDVDIKGNPDEYQSYLDKYNALAAMGAQAAPVTVTSQATPLNNITAFVDSVQRKPSKIITAEGREAYVCALRLIKV